MAPALRPVPQIGNVMYTQRITFFPANGKGPELRTILEERVRQRQAQGTRAGLQSAVFGAKGPAFSLGIQVTDLEALETVRANPLPVDPRIAALTSQPNLIELLEVLLPAQPAGTPPRYLQRVTLTPLPGKGPEMTGLVVDLTKKRQAEGIRGTVSIQAAGAAAGSVLVAILLGSLSELEKMRARNQTDAE